MILVELISYKVMCLSILSVKHPCKSIHIKTILSIPLEIAVSQQGACLFVIGETPGGCTGGNLIIVYLEQERLSKYC